MATEKRTEMLSTLRCIIDSLDTHASNPWKPISSNPDSFLQDVFVIASDSGTDSSPVLRDRTDAVAFLSRAVLSIDFAPIRKAVLRLISVPIWTSGRVPKACIDKIARDNPRLVSMFNAACKRFGEQSGFVPERDAIHNLLCSFLNAIEIIPNDLAEDDDEMRDDSREVDVARCRFCAGCLALFCDLLSQLPTRRFVHTYFRCMQLLPRVRRAPLVAKYINKSDTGRLVNTQSPACQAVRAFMKLVSLYDHYDAFPVDDFTGEALSAVDMEQEFSRETQRLQAVGHKLFPTKLRDLVLSSTRVMETPQLLTDLLRQLSCGECLSLCVELGLLPDKPRDGANEEALFASQQYLLYVLTEHYRKRQSQMDLINTLPLFPSESDLWGIDARDMNSDDGLGAASLALPKLSLQYLTSLDYLERNFRLFSMDATIDVRDDVESAVKRMQTVYENHTVSFNGEYRMALPVVDPHIVRVGEPRLGEVMPSAVVLEFNVSLDQCGSLNWRGEWDSLRPFDVLFLVSFKDSHNVVPDPNTRNVERFDPLEHGVAVVRGCEIMDIQDESGTTIKDYDDYGNRITLKGVRRKIRVKLDGAQYLLDTQKRSEALENGTFADASELYSSFNLVIRRRPEQSNFRAVLETIRNLMNTNLSLPDWLSERLLGFNVSQKIREEGDDDNMTDSTREIDMHDTFISSDHLKQCFPNVNLSACDSSHSQYYRLQFGDGDSVTAIGYDREDSGLRNNVCFTRAQVDAIRAGMGEGMTVVVGPPGTGKTDVAVQIIANLYHSNPQQRIVVVTRSNHALNHIFDKLVKHDIDEKHLMRLGHGEALLQTEKDFSKKGRIDYILGQRLIDLALAGAVAKSVSAVDADIINGSCELAGIFRKAKLNPLWEQYIQTCTKMHTDNVDGNDTYVSEHFPLKGFIDQMLEWKRSDQQNSVKWSIPKGSFVGKFSEDMEYAKQCWQVVCHIFDELEEFRIFELLRSNSDRANFVLRSLTRIVAMTSTHAALRRDDLIDLGFHYDTVVVEEAAQMMEAEAFVPMVMQSPSKSQLKRVVLIGDSSQLPPVVKSRALRSWSGLDRSFFTRLLAIGVPHHVLDAQGRCRPCIAELFNWAYDGLHNLPHVVNDAAYIKHNPGFAHDFQIVDVADHQGHGETCPLPHVYQNLGEAETIVHTYMYMRLLGYPRESIAILTTYNGQKSLLREVVDRRCCGTPELTKLYGQPAFVTTVDQFQGMQSDYVLISLVRTASLGHLRDPRRLIVALSRARLGLYVFCRANLLSQCSEMESLYNRLAVNGTLMQLRPQDSFLSVSDDSKITTINNLRELAQLVKDISTSKQHQKQ